MDAWRCPRAGTCFTRKGALLAAATASGVLVGPAVPAAPAAAAVTGLAALVNVRRFRVDFADDLVR